MPLLDLMTSNNPKMDWYKYGHNVAFNFDYGLMTLLPYICNYNWIYF